MPLPKVEKLALPGVLHVAPHRFGDARGFFCEVYNKAAFQEIGIVAEFIQDNQSLSRDRGVVRGLHFQTAPYAQAKLVRVAKGSIYDAVVDLRRESPTYGKCVGVTLSAELGNQLFVPIGFAHGFCTLEPETEVIYKVDAPYSREHEGGLLWNDPALGIDWPIGEHEAVLIERDRNNPPLSSLPALFWNVEVFQELIG
jgi:dTDP-4-dehydrorhamnose 3,5-epimerase